MSLFSYFLFSFILDSGAMGWLRRNGDGMRLRFLSGCVGAMVGVLVLSAGCSSGYGSAPVSSGEDSEEVVPNASASDDGDLEVVEAGDSVVEESRVPSDDPDGTLYLSTSYGVVLKNTSATDWMTFGEVFVGWLNDVDERVPEADAPEDIAAGQLFSVGMLPPGSETAIAGHDVLGELPEKIDVEIQHLEWLPESDVDEVGEFAAEVSEVKYDREDEGGEEKVFIDFEVSSSYATVMEPVTVFAVMRNDADEIIGGVGTFEQFTFSEGDNVGRLAFDPDTIPDDPDAEFNLYCMR